MKIKELINHFKSNKNLVTILKSLAAIGLVTAVAAISVQYLSGPTLADNVPVQRDIEEISDIDDETVSNVSQPEVEPVIDTDSTIEESIEESIEKSIVEETAQESPIQASSLYISNQIHFYVENAEPTSTRIVYMPGFYIEQLNRDVIDYITGMSLPIDIENPEISCDDLRYVGIIYKDFNNLDQAGELICNKSIAEDLVEIFYELYEAEYQLERVVLIDNYGGDDTASMSANNTSCFNYRVVEGSSSLSNHAYGLAIDVNPFYNPYIVFGANEDGSDYISPSGSEIYVDRSRSFAYKIDENDLCYRLFKEHGFTWGGNWNSCKDYQHFQKK